MELKLDWPGLVKPRVIECMEWLQGDAGNEDAVQCGWRQPLQDGANSCLYLLWSQILCPSEISCDEILIPMVVVSIGGAFVRWWSYKYLASSMRWVLLYMRHTELQNPSPLWGYNKKCILLNASCMTTLWKSIAIVFKSVIFCYSNTEGLRQHPNNL